MAFHTPRGQKASAAAWAQQPETHHHTSGAEDSMYNWTWSKLSVTSLPSLPQGKSYFCTWEIYSHKCKANHITCNSSFWVRPLNGLFVQELSTWDWPQCPRTRWCEIQQRSPVRSWSSTVQKHLRDLRHLSSSCEYITGELGRRQETVVSLRHIGKATETTVHMPVLITFWHSTAGRFPLLFISEEIYTPRQLSKSQKWVGNEEPHVKQLLLSSLAAGQLRCWPECSNYSKIFKIREYRPASETSVQPSAQPHLGNLRHGTQTLCALLVFTAVVTTWPYLTAAMLG